MQSLSSCLVAGGGQGPVYFNPSRNAVWLSQLGQQQVTPLVYRGSSEGYYEEKKNVLSVSFNVNALSHTHQTHTHVHKLWTHAQTNRKVCWCTQIYFDKLIAASLNFFPQQLQRTRKQQFIAICKNYIILIQLPPAAQTHLIYPWGTVCPSSPKPLIPGQQRPNCPMMSEKLALYPPVVPPGSHQMSPSSVQTVLSCRCGGRAVSSLRITLTWLSWLLWS